MGTERIGLIGRVALHARRTAVTKLRGWNARDLGVGGEVGAAGIARRSTFAKDAEAHRAHEADAHRTLVAETRGSKVDAARGGELEVRATAHVQGGGEVLGLPSRVGRHHLQILLALRQRHRRHRTNRAVAGGGTRPLVRRVRSRGHGFAQLASGRRDGSRCAHVAGTATAHDSSMYEAAATRPCDHTR